MVTRKPRALPNVTTSNGAAPTKSNKVESNEDTEELVTAKTLAARSHALWMQIRTEYITRPDAPSVDTLAKKYRQYVSPEAIRRRVLEEKWVALREEWWRKAEVALLQRIQDQYLIERVKEMRLIRQAMPFIYEHLMPIMEKDPNNPGKKRVKRDPNTGMPVFRHGFKSQEGVVRTWLLLQERQMLLRGEATSRTESAIRDRVPDANDDDPISNMAKKANFSREEVRSLARQMLAKRMRADLNGLEQNENEDDENEDDNEDEGEDEDDNEDENAEPEKDEDGGVDEAV